MSYSIYIVMTIEKLTHNLMKIRNYGSQELFSGCRMHTFMQMLTEQ